VFLWYAVDLKTILATLHAENAHLPLTKSSNTYSSFCLEWGAISSNSAVKCVFVCLETLYVVRTPFLEWEDKSVKLYQVCFDSKQCFQHQYLVLSVLKYNVLVFCIKLICLFSSLLFKPHQKNKILSSLFVHCLVTLRSKDYRFKLS